MIARLFLFLFFGLSLGSFAQKPLKHPLSFVSAQSILVIDPTEDNIVQRAMRVSPYLTPQTPELVKDSVKYYRKLLRQSPAVSACDVHTLEQLFLLSGDARYVRALDSLRTLYSAQQKADSTSRIAAQRLLNTLGWVAATEGQKLYVNLRESCLIPINTPQLKVTIDQIVQDGRMKFRITGLPAPLSGSNRTRFTLYLCLPEGVNPLRVFLNGHRLLEPKWERGFLVFDCEWRNMEEIYYELPAVLRFQICLYCPSQGSPKTWEKKEKTSDFFQIFSEIF